MSFVLRDTEPTDMQLAGIITIIEGANDHHLMKQSWWYEVISAGIPKGSEVTKHIQEYKDRI